MKKEFDFDVLIIGGSHFNALGVIRSLGEKGIRPYLLVLDRKNAYIKKSKYLKKTFYSKNDEKEIINKLMNEISFENKKCYIVPTGDPITSIIDNNYGVLSKKYIVPNINNTQGLINKYMDKYEQYNLAQKNNFKMAKTEVIDLKSNNIANTIYPCILKPLVSADGVKADIRICNNQIEFKNAIEEFKAKNYLSVLLQEFIDYDFELDVPGYSDGKKANIEGMIKKKNIYPAKRGSTSYGTIVNSNIKNIDNLCKILESLKYNGIFDIELFSRKGEIYLNEINFRNSAISYGLTGAGVYVIYEWIMSNEGVKINHNTIDAEYDFIVENYNLNLVLSKDITLLSFIKDLFKAKKYTYISFKDPKPLVYKFIYSLKKER